MGATALRLYCGGREAALLVLGPHAQDSDLCPVNCTGDDLAIYPESQPPSAA